MVPSQKYFHLRLLDFYFLAFICIYFLNGTGNKTINCNKETINCNNLFEFLTNILIKSRA